MPGNEDFLNASRLFESADGLGMPLIRKEEQRGAPRYLIPHRARIRTEEEVPGGAVHFFLEDYRFEAVWKWPLRALPYLRGVGSALSPDFSLYPEHPLALQIFNVYRNRWCGAFWQAHGVSVIPTVGWSDEASYPFCFLGIEEGSTVAISTVGLERGSSPEERELFVGGYEEMLRRIEPELVLVYGESPEKLLPAGASTSRTVRTYPSRWKSIREARRRLAGREERPGPIGAALPG